MIDGFLDANRDAIVGISVMGPNGELQVNAVIDTGFSDALTLPDEILTALGLSPIDRATVRLANGALVDVDLYSARVAWDGVYRSVLVQSASTVPLIGVTMLDGYSLLVEYTDGGAVQIELLDG